MTNLDYGIQSIWNADSEYQEGCLTGIVENIRNIKNPSVLGMHVQYLKEQGAFFVHNDSYMVDHFGQIVKDPALGIYRFHKCTLAGRLAIPIRFMDGSVRGFIGYSKKPQDFPEDAAFIKYLYPPKDAFPKARYLYITADEYIKAVKDGYVVIVDGIFDKIILQCMGINAVSLCGSALTTWHQYYLQFIKHKIVVADNDGAGRKLARRCKYSFRDCVEIIQSECNDIDAMLRTDEALALFKKTFDEMRSEGFTITHRLPKLKENKNV